MNPPKNFVGRQRELRSALKVLRLNRSLIVEGPFGIGKTTFAKKVATNFESIALYCSFEDNALAIVEYLNRQIIKYYRPGGARLGTQIQKFLKATEGKRALIIIDDVWKVTIQKVRFFKRLNENQNCQFILVSEVRDKSALLLVKSIAWNNETIRLGKLSKEESHALFEVSLNHFKDQKIISVKKLVESCGGYPLGIIETVRLVQNKSKKYWEMRS